MRFEMSGTQSTVFSVRMTDIQRTLGNLIAVRRNAAADDLSSPQTHRSATLQSPTKTARVTSRERRPRASDSIPSPRHRFHWTVEAAAEQSPDRRATGGRRAYASRRSLSRLMRLSSRCFQSSYSSASFSSSSVSTSELRVAPASARSASASLRPKSTRNAASTQTLPTRHGNPLGATSKASREQSERSQVSKLHYNFIQRIALTTQPKPQLCGGYFRINKKSPSMVERP